MSILTCRDLSLGYDGNAILKHLSFTVNSGDYLCIVGENGSGKSTLMKTILGLNAPIAGQILTGDGLKQTEIGYLPQQTDAQKDFPASVWEIVLSGFQNQCGMRPFYRKEEKEKVSVTLERLHMVVVLTACGAKEQKTDLVQSADNTVSVSDQVGTEVETVAETEQKKEQKLVIPSITATGEIDLTALSSTMIYAEVNNMMANPESYKGRKVKMEGRFAIYEGENQIYYACIVADAAACCSQGIEFVLDGDYHYPEDYPELGSIITVTGVFDSYTENEVMYIQLIDAVMN